MQNRTRLYWLLFLLVGTAALVVLVVVLARNETENNTMPSAWSSTSSSYTAPTTTTYPDNPMTFNFRQFSESPSLSRANGNSTDPFVGDYGAVRVFMQRVQEYTSALPGNRAVNFVWQQWPLTSGCTAPQHVGARPGCVTRDATLEAGSTVAPWADLANAMAFGPDFHTWQVFLHSARAAGTQSGLELLQQLIDERNSGLVLMPVVGSPRQSSGFFKANMEQVGIDYLFQQNWKGRYLNPNEAILRIACNNRTGNLCPLSFISATGGVSVLGAVQTNVIQFFEFAATLDNWDASKGGFFPLPGFKCDATTNPTFPTCSLNAGELGLTHIHYDTWHQQWFQGHMLINKDKFNLLDPEQKEAVYKAARDATDESFELSRSIECTILQNMLDINNGKVQRNADYSIKDCDPSTPAVDACSADMHLAGWRTEDLELLQWAKDQYLEQRKTSIAPDAATRSQYTRLLQAYNEFLAKRRFTWTPESGFPNCVRDD